MENIFKFKKPSKMLIGGFDPDDQQEWALMVKPQIGDATVFVHFHKLWLVTEQPEIEADPDNGIEGQQAITRQSAFEMYWGFIKDDKFIAERQKTHTFRIDQAAQIHLLEQIKFYAEEYSYTKDLDNYKLDVPVTPAYYGHEQGKSSGSNNAMKMLHQVMGGAASVPMQAAVASVPQPNVRKKLSNLFGGIKASPSQNP